MTIKHKKMLCHCFPCYRAEACQACRLAEVVCEQWMRAFVAHVHHRHCLKAFTQVEYCFSHQKKSLACNHEPVMQDNSLAT